VLAFDMGRGRDTADRLGLELDRRVIALCPGAEYGPAKQWPAAHFAALAEMLAERGFRTWIFGSAKDAAIGETIIELARARNRQAVPVNLAGRTQLIEAIDLMSLTHSAVTNDSGLMHVAAAIGTPTVAIFGPTSPWHWKPLNPIAAILEPPGDEPARQLARQLGNVAVSHRRTSDVMVSSVLVAVCHVLNKPS
jgi:heptosyltransferase-2